MDSNLIEELQSNKLHFVEAGYSAPHFAFLKANLLGFSKDGETICSVPVAEIESALITWRCSGFQY